MTITDWIQAAKEFLESNYNDVLLAILMVLLFAICLFALMRLRREGFVISKRSVVIMVMTAIMLGIFMWLNRNAVGPADWAQMLLVVGLVIVTTLYASATFRQARASVKMAEEMREQRRPIVVPEAIEPKGTAFSFGDGEDIEHNPSDYFQIRNVGNGPAIELQIVQLDKEKGLPQIQKKAILSPTDSPLEFYPVDLANQEKTTCYLVCQYRSVLSPNVRQIWYETWLPFVPVKSQRGDRIIIQPKDLEFCEAYERKSY